MLIMDMDMLTAPAVASTSDSSCARRPNDNAAANARPCRCCRPSDDDACLDGCDRRRRSGATASSAVVAAESRAVAAIMVNVVTFIVVVCVYSFYLMLKLYLPSGDRMVHSRNSEVKMSGRGMRFAIPNSSTAMKTSLISDYDTFVNARCDR